MDDQKAPDVNTFLGAIAAAGLTATFTLFPRNLEQGEELGELLPLQRVLELEEGAIMAGEQADMADIVIIGGRLVKNRHGRVCHDAISATVHLGTKFALGQRVGFVKVIGDRNWHCEGEVIGVTQYREREPSYFVRPNEACIAFLKRDFDVQCDEGELHGFDLAAEDPDAIRQAEGGRPVAEIETEELEEELRRIDRVIDLLGSPLPASMPSLDDIGRNRAGELQRDSLDRHRVWREIIINRIQALDAETGKKRTWMP